MLNELVEFAVAVSLDFASSGVSIVSMIVHGWCGQNDQYSPAWSVVALRRAMRIKRRMSSMLCVLSFRLWVSDHRTQVSSEKVLTW
jgi:hypothetical protein